MTDTGFIADLLTHPTAESVNLLGLQVAIDKAIAVCSDEEHKTRQLQFEWEVRSLLEQLAQPTGSIEAAGWQIKYIAPTIIHAIATQEHPELTGGRRRVEYVSIHPEAEILRPVAQALTLSLISDYLTWSKQMAEQKQQRMEDLQQALLQSGLVESEPLTVPAITAFVWRWTEEHPVLTKETTSAK
jgi:hypothetical protein